MEEPLMPAKWLVWSALALVVLAGVLLRASHIQDQHTLTPNERLYLYYAGRIHDEGIGASRALHTEFLNDPGMWASAPPVRIGYLILLDAAMEIMGTTRVEAGMALSFLSSVLTPLLVAWLGVRFFNPWVSLIASALCATAFTEIWLVRGTPEDGVFGLFGLLEIWLACEIMRSPRRMWLQVPFHLVGVWAILIKQFGVFIYGFSALWLLGFLLIRERERRQAMLLGAGAGAATVVVCGLLLWLGGDPHTAWRVNQIGLLANDEGWAYQDECCFGPWTQVPFALFLLSPLTFVLSLAGIATLAVPRNWGSILSPLARSCGSICAIMAVGFVCLFSVIPRAQTLRYVTPGDGAICLVAALGLWSLLSAANRYLARLEYGVLLAFVMLGVVLSMVRDYQVFDKVAMRAGIPELGAALIRAALGI